MNQTLKLRQVLVMLASISLIITIGGAVYEHMTLIPIWTAAPPSSLSMFQGKYGLNSAMFWQTIHPITGVLLIASLVSNWRNQSRKYIIAVFGVWVTVMVVTAIYFVPELLSIIQYPYSDTVSHTLQERASTWNTLSLVRLAVIICFAVVMQIGVMKAGGDSSPGNVKTT